MSAIDWAVAVACILLAFWFSRVCIPWLAMRVAALIVHRRLKRDAPPQGTRPEVRLVVSGITYDVTDSLIDAGVKQDNGRQLWLVLGPQHLRVPQGSAMTVEIGAPVPRKTHVEVLIRGPADGGRFWTFEELAERFPGIEDPRRVS